MAETVRVELGERAYDVRIGSGLIARAGAEIAPLVKRRRVAVITDETVAGLHLAALTEALAAEGIEAPALALPPGEATKSWAGLERAVEWLIAEKVERRDVVVALGGGVIGDLAGFAAAILRRGVRFVQIPTTLLAQVDSSVGGKTGINSTKGKNLIGAFHQPRAVLIDTDTLRTLPDRQLKAGLAEVIKYGAIVDADFFAWLEDNIEALIARDAEALIMAIQRSCELKAQVVAEDEREGGRRAILNFGHTFGHAIERCQGYGEWLHGEAVAAGMVMAAELSAGDTAVAARIGSLVERAGLPTRPPAIPPAELLAAMGMDKKVQQKQLRFVLLRELGEAFVTSDYDTARLDAVLAAAS